jgi:hypothetical protein
MNGMQNNNHYSAKEILRYLGGQMDRREMHALERAALDDDMLADAIEGFRLMRESLSDNTILEKVYRVNHPENKAKKEIIPIFKIPVIKWAGYAVAASFVIASGWWLFSISRPEAVLPADNDIVQQESTVIFDSLKEVESSEKAAPADVAGIDKMPQDNQDKASQARKITPASPVAKKKETVNKDVAVVQTVPSISTDNQAISKVGISRESVIAELKDSGINSAKRMMAADANKDGIYTLMFQISDTAWAIPSIGWVAYEQYLKSNFTLPPNNIPGMARISMDKDAKIEKVEIEGNYTDAEKKSLTEIIINGPAWKNNTAKPVKMVIQWE